MKKHLLLSFLSIIYLSNTPVFAQNLSKSGFNSQNSAKELAMEKQFDQYLSAPHIGQMIKELSSYPHELGSPGSKKVAESVLAKFKEYGWDAQIETYQVLFSTPKTRALELTAPTKYVALLKEPALKEDGTSGQPGELEVYNAWSGDGDVNGQLVYANYGLPEDYEVLASKGIDVKGKIVITRYGRSWRGIKPKVAQEHGAVGCIIYSDPSDDGYTAGDVYPKGPYRNEFGVQRGSVMDMVIYPGDPLTPNVGATKDAKRLDRSEAKNLIKIPVLPISYHDAQPLLAALDGPVAPSDWRGTLPITYHIGPGKAEVHLNVQSNWTQVPCYNVIAKMKGTTYPDQWVIRGNHHDAWVYGAQDPISGLASLLEEAKAIGELAKKGIKPARTLVYAAWDGEEPSLIGSTEWAEDHAAELQQKAVAYINSDGSSRGFLGAGGSHALEPFISDVAKDVLDPVKKVSVYDRKKAQEIVNASSPKQKNDLMSKEGINYSALGSGSDYTAFLQHLGIPSLNLGYGGEGSGGQYHSIYDSYDYYSRFADPGFVYGVTLSETAGRVALRLANADVLPFDFTNLYKTINTYTTELIELNKQLSDKQLAKNKSVDKNLYELAAGPDAKETLPGKDPEVVILDFSALKTALASLKTASEKLNAETNKTMDVKKSQELNAMLYKAEQELLITEGLPKRPWFKHIVYAPGFYTGYGVKTLPGIREAIEGYDWKAAQHHITLAADAINKLSAKLGSVKI